MGQIRHRTVLETLEVGAVTALVADRRGTTLAGVRDAPRQD
ncbi:hypothetical protein [Cellulomonas xiejunii]|nr:hypothetical protein [Cellulomonas xiejunii]